MLGAWGSFKGFNNEQRPASVERQITLSGTRFEEVYCVRAFEKAREHCPLVPLPGEESEDDRMASVPDNGEIPY